MSDPYPWETAYRLYISTLGDEELTDQLLYAQSSYKNARQKDRAGFRRRIDLIRTELLRRLATTQEPP